VSSACVRARVSLCVSVRQCDAELNTQLNTRLEEYDNNTV